MITAQNIREKTFEKSKFGGYDMAEVDEFLEELADDITNTQKEIAVLKSKMKVLVDKIEEYRNSESALNQAVLSAQKLALQIETEAREKADKMIAEADAEVAEKIGSITEKTAIEEKRLETARNASSKFLEGIRAMCNAQLRNLESISTQIITTQGEPAAETKSAPETKPAEDINIASSARPVRAASPWKSAGAELSETAAAVDAAVRSIEASVSRIKPESSVMMDFRDEDMDAPFSYDEEDSTRSFTL